MEREKMLALRAIKELEFDRAMGKVSEEDWKEMSTRLRARAARLMRQLDAGEGYRSQIERELEQRLGESDARPKASRADADARLKPSRYDVASRDDVPSRDDEASQESDTDADARSAMALAERRCASCSTANDPDAKFCKNCGHQL
jgi:hypothetical protein